MRRLRHLFTPGALCLGLLLHAPGLLGSPSARQNPCEAGLVSAGDDPYGYRLRGDRCEGVYVHGVAGTTLAVASLVESFADFQPASGKNLIMVWSAPAGADVRLRARALRRRLYYRMDAIRPAGSTSYHWPTNLLDTFNLRRHELGVVAWASRAVGGERRDVYLPLRIGQQRPARSRDYQLALVAGAELSEVYLSLAPVGADGRPGPYLRRDQALGYGHYPAERSINVTIPKPRARGVYYVEIGATLRDGTSASARLWFYHPG